MTNFAMIGVAGYVAPKHLEAIRDTENRLVAATDPHDSVGIIDQFFPSARYFPEIERFDRHLEKLRRSDRDERVEYVSICSPNYLHDAHIRMALRIGAHAICEKPLVINPWNLDHLEKLEQETGCSINTVLQLRCHPQLVELKKNLNSKSINRRHQVVLTYVASRGQWYQMSWKGDEERSGGLPMNIGIHFFDLLGWLFGEVKRVDLHLSSKTKAAGYLEFERADVRWLLSVDFEDLVAITGSSSVSTHRSISIDGHEVEFSGGFSGLHTRVYEQILAGNGLGIGQARPSIETVYRIRTSRIAKQPDNLHPFVHPNRVMSSEIKSTEHGQPGEDK